MKRFIKSKKGIALLATLAVAAAGAVAGYAYFTANGSGTGSASVGTASSIAITGNVTNALYPGSSQAFPITVSNPGSGHQYVQTVSGSVSAAPSGCPTTDFSMANVPVTADLAAGGSTVVTGTLAMTDANTSQNSCAGGALTLGFSSN